MKNNVIIWEPLMRKNFHLEKYKNWLDSVISYGEDLRLIKNSICENVLGIQLIFYRNGNYSSFKIIFVFNATFYFQ